MKLRRYCVPCPFCGPQEEHVWAWRRYSVPADAHVRRWREYKAELQRASYGWGWGECDCGTHYRKRVRVFQGTCARCGRVVDRWERTG